MKKIVGAGPEHVGDLLGQQLGASRAGCPGRRAGRTSGPQNRSGGAWGRHGAGHLKVRVGGSAWVNVSS